MKIDNHITIYAGAQPVEAAAKDADGAQRQRKTVFAGNLNPTDGLRDRIAEKKQQAQKQAMKIVGDAFEGDRSIDEDMESRRRHISELQEERLQLREEQAGVEARQEALDKAYESGEVSRADYVSESIDLSKEQQMYAAKIGENEGAVLEENAIIRGTRLERLKSNPMGEAREQAEAILEAAGEEIIGMAAAEAKEKLDEETAERQEQAAEIKEEREAQEAFIEKQKEKHSATEEIVEALPTEELVSLDKVQADVKQEVQNMLDKMKLLAEDIKGAAVDETL